MKSSLSLKINQLSDFQSNNDLMEDYIDDLCFYYARTFYSTTLMIWI